MDKRRVSWETWKLAAGGRRRKCTGCGRLVFLVAPVFLCSKCEKHQKYRLAKQARKRAIRAAREPEPELAEAA